MSVPNQYKMTIHREPSPNRDFIQIHKAIFAKAYKALSRAPGALALYIWLVGNQNGYTFEFSPQAIYNNLGMATSTTHDAIARLIGEGFVVKNLEKAHYDFYEVAREKSVVNEKVKDEEKNNNECERTPVCAKVREFTF